MSKARLLIIVPDSEGEHVPNKVTLAILDILLHLNNIIQATENFKDLMFFFPQLKCHINIIICK